MNLKEIKEDREHCYAGVDYELEELVDWLIAEVEEMKIQSEELCHMLAVVLTISDRKHDAWDRAKAALAKARGEVDHDFN